MFTGIVEIRRTRTDEFTGRLPRGFPYGFYGCIMRRLNLWSMHARASPLLRGAYAIGTHDSRVCVPRSLAPRPRAVSD